MKKTTTTATTATTTAAQGYRADMLTALNAKGPAHGRIFTAAELFRTAKRDSFSEFCGILAQAADTAHDSGLGCYKLAMLGKRETPKP
jgi:hypothetical protein